MTEDVHLYAELVDKAISEMIEKKENDIPDERTYINIDKNAGNSPCVWEWKLELGQFIEGRSLKRLYTGIKFIFIARRSVTKTNEKKNEIVFSCTIDCVFAYKPF